MEEPSTQQPPALRVVLFGGIGSGKSTVGRMLAELGAVVIDADAVGHDVLQPGGSAHAAVARRWPSVVVGGEIDRRALAAIVFEDLDQLRELEAITHPAITAEIARRVAAVGERPIVVEIPLTRDLLGKGWTRVLVDAPVDVRTQRVVDRGSAPADVARRMAAQPSQDEWRAAADGVIVNDADTATLRQRVEAMWRSLTAAHRSSVNRRDIVAAAPLREPPPDAEGNEP